MKITSKLLLGIAIILAISCKKKTSPTPAPYVDNKTMEGIWVTNNHDTIKSTWLSNVANNKDSYRVIGLYTAAHNVCNSTHYAPADTFICTSNETYLRLITSNNSMIDKQATWEMNFSSAIYPCGNVFTLTRIK